MDATETTSPVLNEADVARMLQHDRDHVLTSWSTQSTIDPLPVAGGEGAWFWTHDGRRFLDFQSQLVNLNLGHQHPRLVESIKRQADKLCYISPGAANEARSELGAQLAEITPGNLTASYFTTGGAAAVESAIKLARHVTGRSKVIARNRSYHGATMGTVTVGGDPRRWDAEPGVPGVVRMLDPYTYRCPAGHPDPCPVCTGAPHFEEILMYENPETVAAVVLETVTGTNGIIYPPDGYLKAIREVCDKHGIMLILDEVMVGFGRTGTWFACDHYDVVPDILCVAKGISSGYVPLGAMIVSAPIRAWLEDNRFSIGQTYAGHPLACAVGVESIKVFQDEDILNRTVVAGKLVTARLNEMADRRRCIGDVRGRGLFHGVELVRDRETKEPLVPFGAKGAAAAPMTAIIRGAKERGLILANNNNVIRLAPPLITHHDDLELGLAILDELLGIVDEEIA